MWEAHSAAQSKAHPAKAPCMTEWPTPLALLALIPALWLLTKALIFGLTLREVLRLRYRQGQAALAEEAEVPEDTRQLLQGALPPWERLGFQPLGWLRIEGPFTGQHQQSWQLLLEGAGPHGPCYAFIQVAAFPNAEKPTLTSLATLRADGEGLESISGLGRLILGRYPRTTFHDEVCPDDASLLASHHQAAAAFLGPEAQSIGQGLQAWAERQNLTFQNYVLGLERDGLVQPTGKGAWRIRWKTALGMTWRLLFPAGASQDQAANPHQKPKEEGLSPEKREATVAAECLAFQKVEGQAKPGQGSLALKLLLFFLSGALFLYTLPLLGLSNQLQGALVLTGVLLFHELGHLLAMKALGYHDPSILFIPGLGALTHGRSQAQLRPEGHLLMVLMGPLPGLLLGLAALAWWQSLPGPHPTLLKELCVMLLAINLFNLLPLKPLDGGRLVEGLLESFPPAAHLAFRAFSLLGHGFLAWLYFPLNPWVSGVFALFGAIALGAWRWESRLRLLAEASTPGMGEAERIQSLFRRLGQPPFARLSYLEKHHLVRGAMALPLQRKLSPKAWCLWAAIYLICSGGPMLFFAWWLPWQRFLGG